MPRVPIAPVTTGQIQAAPSAQAAVTIGLANQAAGVLNQAGQDALGVSTLYTRIEQEKAAQAKKAREVAEKRLADARRTDLFIEESSKMNRGISALKDNAQNPEAFTEAVDLFVDESVAAIQDQEVALQVKQRGMFAADSAIVSVTASHATAQREEARRSFRDEVVSDYAEATARGRISNNDVEVTSKTTEFAQNLALNQHFSKEQKSEIWAQFIEESEGKAIEILIESARADPLRAERELVHAELLLGKQFSPNIDTDDRLTYRSAIDSARKAAARRISGDRTKEVNRIENALVGRLADPDSANDPDLIEVLKLNLPRASTEHFKLLIDRKNNGFDIAQGIPAVETSLIDRVYNPNSRNPITRVGQLMEYINTGLSLPMFQTLNAAIERGNNPDTKEEQKHLEKFINSQKGFLVKSFGALGGNDPNGETAYNDFTMQMNKVYWKKRSEGFSEEQLLQSESNDWLGKITPEFQSTFIEKLDESMKMYDVKPFIGLKGNRVIDDMDPGVPTPIIGDVVPRQPDETPEEYFKRINP